MAHQAADNPANVPVTAVKTSAPAGRRPWWRPLRAVVRKAHRAAVRMSGYKPLEGFVDRILAGEVLGWAFDPNKPARRVHIVARHDGQIVAETLADLPRKDLVRNAKGDGRHGFNLRIPAALLDGEPRTLRIEAAIGRKRVLLRGGEVTVSARRPKPLSQAPRPQTQAQAQAQLAGVLEKVVDNVLFGWAGNPRASGTVVVDVYDDERYLGSVAADRPRPRLQETAKGARGFQFRLPEDADEALPGRLRARIAGTRLDLKGLDVKGVDGRAPAGGRPARPAPAPAARTLADRAPAVALLVVGEAAPDSIRRTTRSWTDQTWPDILIGRVCAAAGEGEHVFGAGDVPRIESFLRRAAVVVFVRPGEMLDPAAAGAVARARPLADVMTWDIGDRDGGPVMRRRSEAWPLALMLGGSLGGSFAVRGSAAAPYAVQLAQAAADGGRAFEMALARDGALRWAHLPGVLSSCQRDAARPPRLEACAPAARAGAVTVAVWPKWSAAAHATAAALADRLGDREVEVLIPVGAPDAALPANATVRRFDAPERGGAGAWLRALGGAATGEAVVFCRAGQAIAGDADIAALADWSLSPMVGAVTGELAGGDQVLAGVTVAASRQGWRIITAFDSSRAGLARPVLAAPAALIAVDRAKLAAVGGFDHQRFPDTGAAFDLCLRLRRMGWTTVVLGSVRASFDAPLLRREASAGLVHFEVAELAAAAAAYPPPGEARPRAGDAA